MPKVRRKYTIDLSQAPGKRWSAMIRAERSRARKLIGQAMADGEQLLGQAIQNYLDEHPRLKVVANLLPLQREVPWLLKSTVPKIAKWVGQEYTPVYEDIQAWSRGTGINENELILANLVYELSSACTAVAFNLPHSKGVAHVRNMDWPMIGIGPHSCIIEYIGACGPFTTLGWPSYLGVLSGIAKGRFSATINQAPKEDWLPTTGWPASFALRYVFENCQNYEDAVSDLLDTTLSTPALYMLAGVEPGEACVIEHAGEEAHRRDMKGGIVAVANHYEKKTLTGLNDEDCSDSRARRRCAVAGAKASRSPKTPTQFLDVLNDCSVLHDFTAQQMAFIPKTGKHVFVYHDTDQAVREFQQEGGEEQ